MPSSRSRRRCRCCASQATKRVSPSAGSLTSRQWPMLLEVIADGYWAQMLWRFADAVNGGPGIDTGNGLQPPTRQLARDGLGCTG